MGYLFNCQKINYLGCIRLTLFRLFRNKNKISKLSPDSQSNQISKLKVMTGARDVTQLCFSSDLAGIVANKIEQSFYSVYFYSGMESIERTPLHIWTFLIFFKKNEELPQKIPESCRKGPGISLKGP